MRSLIVCLILLAPRVEAGEVEAARAFFDELVKRTNAFDASVGDLYSPDARIITLRDGTRRMEMTGSQWAGLLKQVMPAAESRGDRSTFEDVQVTPHSDGYRVTATRFPAVKCVPDTNYHLDVVQVAGSWRVVEEYSETVSLSRCRPSEELQALLEKTRNGVLPHLPLDLDEDTRLEAVEILGSALIYQQRLHTITVDEMDMEKLVALLRQNGVQNVCHTPSIRVLADEGATVRFAYVDREDTHLTNVDVPPGICP